MLPMGEVLFLTYEVEVFEESWWHLEVGIANLSDEVDGKIGNKISFVEYIFCS